ncbi:MAG TPA: hypothetical protein VHW45_03080 [Candidatus Sulfotelmatobacter sp.]|nr:hypothetical protein [Candidatus Sulfotelmatobacter sp.]
MSTLAMSGPSLEIRTISPSTPEPSANRNLAGNLAYGDFPPRI